MADDAPTPLRNGSPREHLHWLLQNVDEMESVQAAVHWKTGRVTIGWSSTSKTDLLYSAGLFDHAIKHTIYGPHDCG